MAHKPPKQSNGSLKRTRDKHEVSKPKGPGHKPQTSPGFVPPKFKP